MAELAKLPPVSPADLEMWYWFNQFDRKIPLVAGGILDQPAAKMAQIQAIDYRMALVQKLLELEEKAEAEKQNFMAAFKSLPAEN